MTVETSGYPIRVVSKGSEASAVFLSASFTPIVLRPGAGTPN